MALPVWMKGMLSGIRVLDLTRMLAGPYGSLLLSDLGAQVIKIEQPGSGDMTRDVSGKSLCGFSPYFASINRNKLSVALDLKKTAGQALFHALVRHADVVFDNFRPSVLARLRCDYPTLNGINPKIICCSLSGFGKDGPYRERPAYDLIVQAMGGAMSVTGHAGGEPAVMGLHIGDQAGGMFAALAIASALFQRTRTGTGQAIDIGLLDCQISLLAFLGQTHLATGAVPGREGSAHPLIAPFKGFKTSDGFIVAVAFQDKHFESLCRVLGTEELLGDDRFDEVNKRADNKKDLYRYLDAAFEKQSSSHWLGALERAGIPCGPVNDVQQALADPQVLSRNMVVEQKNSIGEYRVIGNPIKSTEQEDGQFGPPPRIGEHTGAVLKELLGTSDEELEKLRAQGVIQT